VKTPTARAPAVAEAPLFVQTNEIARWLLANLPTEGPLEQRIHDDALALLDHIVLALKQFERERNLDEADARTALLRIHLRLACELGKIERRQLVFLTGELDAVGRQIGGWQKRLAQDTVLPHRR
jgi:hypothetical protein